MTQVIIKPIIPKGINVAKFQANVLAEMQREVRTDKELFKRTVNTWQKPPAFNTVIELQGPDLVGLTFTDSEVYRYIDMGTRVRWALMTSDFRAKTKPTVLSSTKGKGGAIIMGKQAMQARGIKPRPGIKARKFAHTIMKIRKPLFKKNIDRAIRQAAK